MIKPTNNKMLKPPISRMGGKSKLRKTIINRIPQHICYVEVFLGAGWVYFGKDPSKVEVINDVESEITNLYKMMKHHSEEIERLLQYEVSARDQFEDYKHNDTKAMTEIQRAVRFLYLISQSFASKGNNYGYKTASKPSGKIFDFDFSEIKQRLRNTFVENQDFERLIKRYDRPHTFFYCDPPYYETAGYENPFTKVDHIRLSKILKGIQGQFLLSINDHPFIRELYKDCYIEEVNVEYSVSKEKKGRGEYKELLISNYNSKTEKEVG